MIDYYPCYQLMAEQSQEHLRGDIAARTVEDLVRPSMHFGAFSVPPAGAGQHARIVLVPGIKLGAT